MLNTFGKNSQCECFSACHRFCARTAILHYARNLRNLCDPASIFLLLDFDGKGHDSQRIGEKRRKLKSIRLRIQTRSRDEAVARNILRHFYSRSIRTSL